MAANAKRFVHFVPIVTQIGKALGARVVAVARGPDKCAVLEGLGADLVIDTSTLQQPLKAAIKEVAPKGTTSSCCATCVTLVCELPLRGACPTPDAVHGCATHVPGPVQQTLLAAGVDVVFDPVGGPLFAEALKCVRWGAHILIIGFAAGIPKIPVRCCWLYVPCVRCFTAYGKCHNNSPAKVWAAVGLQANIIMVKNITLHGVYWGSYSMHSPRPLRRSLEDSIQWLAEGKVRPRSSFAAMHSCGGLDGELIWCPVNGLLRAGARACFPYAAVGGSTGGF